MKQAFKRFWSRLMDTSPIETTTQPNKKPIIPFTISMERFIRKEEAAFTAYQQKNNIHPEDSFHEGFIKGATYVLDEYKKKYPHENPIPSR